MRQLLPKYILVFLFITGLASSTCVYNAHAQDEGTIKGKVVTKDGEPAPYVSVILEETSYGASTGKEGKFTFKAPVGEYKLKISSVGLTEKKVPVKVKAGKTVKLETIQLEKSIKELNEIIVSGSLPKKIKYSNQESDYVNKLPMKKIDNPQVYNSISTQLLDEQLTTSVEEGLDNAPGITKLWEATGRGGDGAGYYALRGFSVQPTMRNGVPAVTNSVLDPVNVNAPLSEEEDISLRLTSAYQTQNSWQDAGFSESFFIGPSLSYDVNEKLTFTVNTEFYQVEHTNPTMLFLNRFDDLEYENLEQLNYNPDYSYTSNDITINNPSYNIQAITEYKLSDRWTSKTIISRSRSKTKGYYSYLWDFAAPSLNQKFGRYIQKDNSITTATDIQQNFIGDFQIAGIQNKLVVGLDYLSQQVTENSTGFVLHDMVELGNGDPKSISQIAVDTTLAGSAINKSISDQRTYSTYLSDVINILPNLSVLASVRFDYFDNRGTFDPDNGTTSGSFTQTALSPKFGAVYQPLHEKISIFANYQNGFTYPDPRTQSDGSIKTFEPERANQWEGGVKTRLIDDKLMATVTYYNITVSNKVRRDPDNVGDFIQDGKNHSQGGELSVTASPVKGLNLVLGASHNISKIQKASKIEEGKRPEEAGPKTLVNGWASYRISQGALEGWGIGTGGNYASENNMMNTYGVGTFTLPSYKVVDAAIFYEQPQFKLTFKVNNITDAEYYKGWTTVNPQMPRNVRGSFSYRF